MKKLITLFNYDIMLSTNDYPHLSFFIFGFGKIKQDQFINCVFIGKLCIALQKKGRQLGEYNGK